MNLKLFQCWYKFQYVMLKKYDVTNILFSLNKVLAKFPNKNILRHAKLNSHSSAICISTEQSKKNVLILLPIQEKLKLFELVV